MNDDQIRQFVFTNLIGPYVHPFFVADRAYQNKNKASLFSLALLSTLSPLKYIDPNLDVSIYLDKANLSPYDFKEIHLKQTLESLKNPTLSIAPSIGVRIQGQGMASFDLETQVKIDAFKNKDVLLNADLSGRIDVLRKSEFSNRVLRSMFTYPAIAYDEALGAWQESVKTKDRNGQSINRVIGPVSAWRDPRNYFAALGMIDSLNRDEFFQKTSLTAWLNKNFDFMKDVKTFDDQFRKLNFKKTMRALNLMALNNIARFFDTTADKLIKVKATKNKPVQYKVKG
ncbi:hypothetical protein EBR96_10625 [bacterium]|nr:hypothetical protein [bacterium]